MEDLQHFLLRGHEPSLEAAYHPAVLLAARTAAVDAVILVSIIVPLGGFAVFAWWFLRAGKRYDERERAPQSNGRPPR